MFVSTPAVIVHHGPGEATIIPAGPAHAVPPRAASREAGSTITHHAPGLAQIRGIDGIGFAVSTGPDAQSPRR